MINSHVVVLCVGAGLYSSSHAYPGSGRQRG